MNPRTIKSLSFALLGLLLFFAVVILFRIYSDKDVPAQFTGALLGAIVTAAITMALLHGQSQAEETKERNVKVFEEKTKRYNDFLTKLWKVWEDRHVTLEELNDLMETFSRDIIIYTKKDSTDQLLDHLSEIAKYSGDEALTEEGRTDVRKALYNIINVLAGELNLGGQLCDDTQKKLRALDDKIRPFLLTKEYRQKLLVEIESVLNRAELPVDLGKPYYGDWVGDEYLWTKLDGGPVELCIGPVSNRTGTDGRLIGFFVEHRYNPEFQEFRQTPSGFGRNFLGEMRWDQRSDHRIAHAIPDFSKPDSVEAWVGRYRDKSAEKSPGTKVGEMLAQYVQEWKHEGRDIKSMIDECCNPKP